MPPTMDLNAYADEDFGPGVKRRKVSNDIPNRDKFAPGSIMKLKLENFVVYSLTEFVLSPSLNMIIAPNGTGKSTFVCAVCLGLAGSPQLLGRQKHVSEFIKNGEESASIEITLKNVEGERDLTIRRDIYATNKSDWYVNGRSMSEQKVKQTLQALNVQLDNLCQFLPQEKVADFAKLSQEELLLETQRAIDVNMLHQHQQLIELDKAKETLSVNLAHKQKEFTDLEQDRMRYEEEAKKYEAFQKKKAELDDHHKLLPYAEIQDLKRQAEQLKIDRDQMKKELEQYLVEIAPFQAVLQDINADAEKYLNATNDSTRELQKIDKEIQKKQKSIETYDKNIGELKTRITRLENKVQEAVTKLDDAKKRLADEEERLGKIEDVDEEVYQDVQKQSDTLHGEIAQYEDKLVDVKDASNRAKRNVDEIDHRVGRLQESLTSKDRLYMLNTGRLQNNQMVQQAKKVVQYMREHHRGSTELFEPPCLTVTAKDPVYASFLDSLVDFQTKFAITATSKEAYNRFTHEVVDKMKLNAPMRYLSGRPAQAKLSREELQSYGFDGYLRDFVDGPEPVVQMLCDISFIHDVPVSKRPLSEKQIERLRNPRNGQLVFRKFFAGDTMYALSQSRYGSRQINMRTESADAQSEFFSTDGMTLEAKENVNRQIEGLLRDKEQHVARVQELRQQYHDISAEKSGLEDQFEECKSKLKEFGEKKKAKSKVLAKIDLHKTEVKRYEMDSKKDYSAEIVKDHKRIKVLTVQRIKEICEIAELQSKYNDLAQNITLLKVQQFEQKSRAMAMEGLFRSIEQRKRRLEEAWSEAKRRYQAAKNDPRLKEVKAMTQTYDAELKERLAELIQTYSDEGRFTKDNVLEMIESFEAELSLLGNSSKSSVKNLERIQEQIKTLEEEIPVLEMEVKQNLNSIREVHSVWEPKLLEMADNISRKFAEIFPTVGSAGEVRVARADTYSDWKMEIMVKFRDNADLKPLDSHTQSGGERAVSTVYYMMSMQELTKSPFRVVDEINQGMDARNERIVHKNMVEIACQEFTSQYFLITPKLLPNLHYADKMRIHCIMAGPWVPDPKKSQEFLSLGATAMFV